jgi:hypothetical protein
MKRTMELSIAILFGCLFVGYVLKAEAATARSVELSAQVQADDGCDSNGTDYWSLFSAAAAAQ